MTKYDKCTQKENINVLKTFLPYLNPNYQKMVSMIIPYLEYQEVQKSLNGAGELMACQLDHESKKEALKKELLELCSPKERELFQNLQLLLNQSAPATKQDMDQLTSSLFHSLSNEDQEKAKQMMQLFQNGIH